MGKKDAIKAVVVKRQHQKKERKQPEDATWKFAIRHLHAFYSLLHLRYLPGVWKSNKLSRFQHGGFIRKVPVHSIYPASPVTHGPFDISRIAMRTPPGITAVKQFFPIYSTPVDVQT
jgi:hypothetical protein